MNSKNLVRAALALAVAASAQAGFAADFSDTSIGIRYGRDFAEPFVGGGISKKIINLTHVDGSKSGSNFFNIDLLQSDSKDDNAQEAYVVYRHTFDLGALMDRQFDFGPVRGVGLTAGFDWNTKNDPGFGSRKRMLVVGPTFSLKTPGFLNAGIYLLNESNQPAAAHIARHTFDPHPMLGLAWGIPIAWASGFSFEGYLNWIAAKGANEFGGPTAPEFNFDGAIMYDASRWVGADKGRFKVGFEYQYWRNKFGNPSSVPGSLARTPEIRAEYHF
jgi:nucleoside-specific outer membrane channel protein Tsx